MPRKWHNKGMEKEVIRSDPTSKANDPKREFVWRTKTEETPHSLEHQESSGGKMYRESLYSVSNITAQIPDKKMGGASAPVEVGTRGTVGSLLKKEIDYFRRLEVDGCGSSRQRNAPEPASGGGGGGATTTTTSSSSSWTSFRFLALNLNLNLTWRRKKKRGSGGVRPGICSIVEVADTHRLNEIPGFSYRNLRVDSKEFEISTEI